jgi:hypothetical protein
MPWAETQLAGTPVALGAVKQQHDSSSEQLLGLYGSTASVMDQGYASVTQSVGVIRTDTAFVLEVVGFTGCVARKCSLQPTVVWIREWAVHGGSGISSSNNKECTSQHPQSRLRKGHAAGCQQ